LPDSPVREWSLSCPQAVHVGNEVTVILEKDQDPGFAKLIYRPLLDEGKRRALQKIEVPAEPAKVEQAARAARRAHHITELGKALRAPFAPRYRDEDFPPVTLKARRRP